MTQSSQNANQERLYPPRFCALKRSALTLLVLSVSLGRLWLWWSHTASTRLQARIAEIKARGEPLYPADFDTPPIPDDQNAATYLREAIDNQNKNADPPSATALDFDPPYPPFDSSWHQLASQAITGNTKSLALVRHARAIGRVYWGSMPVSVPMIGSNPKRIAQVRHLANLLGDSALYAHLHGDDAVGLDRIRDLLYEAWAVRQRPSVVDALVSIGIDAMAVQNLTMMAPNLQIAPGSASSSEHAVRELINQLLDDSDLRQAVRFAIFTERAWDRGRFDSDRQASRILRPMLDLDEVRLFDENNLLSRQAEQTSWTAAARLRKPSPPRSANQQDYVHLMSKELHLPDRYIEQAWREIAMRRVAAIALSIRLYRVDHGHWPADLQELVPDFLPSVPLDPFDTRNGPIQYITVRGGLPDGSDRHLLLFSSTTVGSPPPTPIFGWQQGAAQWRDLTIWAPAPPATAPSIPQQQSR